MKLERPIKTKHIIFRLTKGQMEKLRELAYSEGSTMSEYVRSIVRDHLSKVEKREG